MCHDQTCFLWESLLKSHSDNALCAWSECACYPDVVTRGHFTTHYSLLATLRFALGLARPWALGNAACAPSSRGRPGRGSVGLNSPGFRVTAWAGRGCIVRIA
eukprot:9473415-Pyramimonas_sp.AAC.1